MQNTFMRSSFLPKCHSKFTRISALPSNKLPGQKSQIREQMSGPEISQYEKSILGCGLWSGLECEIKGSGPIMSKF